MAQTVPITRRRRASRTTHRLLGLAAIAGWALMPLMPLLAFAFTWLRGL